MKNTIVSINLMWFLLKSVENWNVGNVAEKQKANIKQSKAKRRKMYTISRYKPFFNSYIQAEGFVWAL